MSSLKDLQESFQRGILAGDDSILAEIKDSAKDCLLYTSPSPRDS